MLDEEQAIVTPEMFLIMDYVFSSRVLLFDRWDNEQCRLIIPPPFIGKPTSTRYITPQNLKIELLKNDNQEKNFPLTATQTAN